MLIASASWLPLVAVAWPHRPYLIDLAAQLAMQLGLAGMVVGLVLLMIRERKWGGITALAGCVTMLAAFGSAMRGSLPTADHSEGGSNVVRVRVVTFNAHSNTSQGDTAFEYWLLRQDADLVCIVDPPTNYPETSPLVKEAFPFAAAPQYGMDWPILWLSRTPMESIQLVPYAEETKFSVPARRTLRITVDAGAEVLFTGMYPRSPRFYSYWKQSVQSVGVDAQVIRRWLAERPNDSPPLIIAGDFNSTPTGRTHSIMRTSGLKAFSPAVGAGTFPALLPRWLSLPLDRIWATQDVAIRRWVVGPRFKSDHRPVVIDLQVNRRN